LLYCYSVILLGTLYEAESGSQWVGNFKMGGINYFSLRTLRILCASAFKKRSTGFQLKY